MMQGKLMKVVLGGREKRECDRDAVMWEVASNQISFLAVCFRVDTELLSRQEKALLVEAVKYS